MNKDELFELVDSTFEDTKSWQQVAAIVNAIAADRNVDFTPIPKTPDAWRKWRVRVVEADEAPVPKVATTLPDSTVDTIVDQVWATTQLDPDLFEVDIKKVWSNAGPVNYSANIRRKITQDVYGEIAAALAQPDWTNQRRAQPSGDLLWIPALFDAHIGKRQNNYGIADYLHVLDDLHNHASANGLIGEVLYPLGQDLGHIDNIQAMTTAGTPQETSADPQTIVKWQAAVAVQSIRYLASKYPVRVAMVRGNHDAFSNMWLGELVRYAFENHPNVTVDAGPSPRKYYLWGKVMFMIVHGNEEKLHNLVALISSEAREMWGLSNHAVVLHGHLHTQRKMVQMLDEDHGVVVRHLPSLSGTDNWHLTKGYTGNSRGAIGLLYDREWGYVAEHFSNLGRWLAND